MRIHTVALCGILLLALTTSARATSSSVHKKHSTANAAATGKSKSAPATKKTVRRKSTSLAERRSPNKNPQPARHHRAATRNPRRPQQPEVDRASLHFSRHHRMTRGEKRLARLRERELALRQAAPLETESIERHGTLDAEPVRHTESAVLAPSPLKGSRESLVRQNERTEEEGLERIEDDDDLNDRIASGAIVPVPINSTLAVNQSLPENRRYCRPWTADFLRDLARAHATQFPHPLMVTSAVRTVEYQKKLKAVNGNAAAAEGDVASPHLTGASIDIAKSPMSRKEIAWMRRQLLAMQKTGQIDVEEEFRQACFHITVYNSYEPQSEEQPRSKRHITRATAHSTSQPTDGADSSGE